MVQNAIQYRRQSAPQDRGGSRPSDPWRELGRQAAAAGNGALDAFTMDLYDRGAAALQASLQNDPRPWAQRYQERRSQTVKGEICCQFVLDDVVAFSLDGVHGHIDLMDRS